MYSYISPEQKVRADHPLRAVRAMADAALQNMSERFDAMYAKTARPSIPPEKLLGATDEALVVMEGGLGREAEGTPQGLLRGGFDGDGSEPKGIGGVGGFWGWILGRANHRLWLLTFAMGIYLCWLRAAKVAIRLCVSHASYGEGRAPAGEGLCHVKLTTPATDKIEANHVLWPVVAALDEQFGSEDPDEALWCVLAEDHNQVHPSQGCEDNGTGLLVLDRASRAFQRSDRLVAVYADD
jgi:hypothetical protein